MDCESIPSCAEMGYTQDSCSGGKGVRCPFDENKFYCAGVKQLPDAPEPVVTPEDWTAECADKINYCTAYNTECQCTACESGYLLSDGACVPECDKSVDICAAENKTFNSANCVCEACPTNYQFNSETKACEQIACDTTKVEHCATYSSDYEPCTCQTCETNYLLVDGICKKMCTVVENCTAYDSEYDPCNCTACEDGLTLVNGVCVDPCVEKCKIAYPLFAGQDYTKAAIDQIGNKALAAYATHQFYVGDKDGDFGQGKWYLPAIGELMYTYGTDMTQVVSEDQYGNKGAKGDNQKLINTTLTALSNKGVETDTFSKKYWSSSEHSPTYSSWYFTNNIITYAPGARLSNVKSNFSHAVRCSLILKDIFDGKGVAPKIGDVVYIDKSYGSVSYYDGSKTPVGVVTAVSNEKKDIAIINLKNLTFSSEDEVDNFDADNPYAGGLDISRWSSFFNSDVIGIFDMSESSLATFAQASDNCPCQLYKPKCDKSVTVCAMESKIFNEESCTCEACPSGYLFDNEVNECREACKKDVDNCYEYDSKWPDCKCVACYNEDGHTNGDQYYIVYYDLGSYSGYHGEKGTCQREFCDNYQIDCDYYCKRCSATEMGVCEVCSDGFTLEDNKCIPPTGTCVEGSILYDDLNCYNPESVPTGRTAIGVVYMPVTGRLLALSLDEATLPWSENLVDTETGCNSENDGQANTDCIIAAGAEENSAAVYCSKYGVTNVDRGKWFLLARRQYVSPSSRSCLAYFSLSKALGKIPDPHTTWLDSTLSSTEDTSTRCWYADGWGGYLSYYGKARKGNVRCVLDFQKLK